MDNKAIFNATICLIGIAIFLIHIVDLLFKKEKRKDELTLLSFIAFTAVHFTTYLVFTYIKSIYTSNALIIGFYTTFYILNNVQLLLFVLYALDYIKPSQKSRKSILFSSLIILFIYISLDILNIFTHFFFYAEGGIYIRAKTMILSQGYQFISFAVVFFLAAFSKKLDIGEKITFSIYCLLPFIAIGIQNMLAGYAIAYLSIIIAIEILFLFLNVRKNIELANEAKRNKEAEIKIMMSQIKPHFIYNTLASISTLIKIDADKAQIALDNFTEYLRANLASLTDTGLIHFEDELKHIHTYLSLEKMRFNERLNIHYDIRFKDFLVPPLSIQPLVENAVKHGILKNIKGGLVNLKTYKKDKTIYIEVSDNGVGFDPKSINEWDNRHIGLNNVRIRLETMCNGKLEIDSKINKGTKVKVSLPN